MKIRLTFKTPDVLEHLSDEDNEQCRAVIGKFIKYEEYVTIELDSENGSATVVPVK
jgi:hypothetical protein